MSQSAQASDNKQSPLHIGIIMDGNGRWAQKRGLARTAGHKEGLETAKKYRNQICDIIYFFN